MAAAAALGAGLANAQDETGGQTPAQTPATGQADFWTAHLPADLMGWGWVAAVFGVAYGAGTIAFVMFLNGRSPAVALRYAIFWMCLVFVGLHFLIFTQLLALGLPWWAGFAIGLTIVLLVVIIVILMRRKR